MKIGNDRPTTAARNASEHIDYSGIVAGRHPDKPFRIVALLNARAVGDLIFFHIYSASTKLLFDHSSLTIYQRNDRKYKLDLLEMNEHINYHISASSNFGGIFIDSFQEPADIVANGETVPDYICREAYWTRLRMNQPDMLLQPGNMPHGELAAFEEPAFLKVPDRKVDAMDEALLRHGVRPDRWICVVNYREPGYKFRPSRPKRDLDPRPFMELTDFIIRQGGQVVRIGHPNMTRFPDQDGFIDLAPIEDQFLLHAHAVGRARFMVGSLTGTSHLGSAMNTPTAITNCIEAPYFPGCWRDHDIALYVSCFDRDKRRVPVWEQIRDRTLDPMQLSRQVQDHGWTVKQNSPAQLIAVAKELMDATVDCQKWREPYTPLPSGPRPNRVTIPAIPRIRPRIFEVP